MNTRTNRHASLADEVKERYIERYCENGTLKTFAELDGTENICKVKYSDLPYTEIDGYPFASQRGDDGELYFSFYPNSHEICVGTTGSGKTTGCVEPRIRSLSYKKNKPCLFITDPKGEVFERNAKHLRNQGYKIYLINFKDVSHSDCWNPLAEIYDSWMRQTKLNEKPQFHSKYSEIDGYELRDSIEYYNKKQGFWTLGKDAFPTEDAVNRYITFKRSIILSETEDLIHQLVHTLIPDTVLAKNDPSWMMGAQDILSGLIYVMLEDALDERSGFTRDNMSLMTIQEYYERIRDEVLCESVQRPLLKTRKLFHKNAECISIRKLKAYFENAPTTTRSYLGCFRNAMQQWFNSKIFTISNGVTIMQDDYEETPFAVFLITRDYEKSDFTIAGLFIDWVYRYMLLKAEENGGRLKREMYFILDEFCNVPAIKNFENKIATARSRNIWFHMFVQSYAQLDVVYGTECSQIIRDNCNSHVFLGSQNYETKQMFSRECGRHMIYGLRSFRNMDNRININETALVPISALEELENGKMYLRRTGMPLIKTQFERSYLCSEFKADNYTTPEQMHINSIPFNSEKYHYRYLSSLLTMEQFGSDRETDGQNTDQIPDFIRFAMKQK